MIWFPTVLFVNVAMFLMSCLLMIFVRLVFIRLVTMLSVLLVLLNVLALILILIFVLFLLILAMRKLDVLVACEESQAVCKAFRALGHNAFSCDLQKCSGGHPEWHIISDVVPLLDGYCYFMTEHMDAHKLDKHWDLIIAHPPCTYLTKAGSTLMYPQPGCIDKQRYGLMLHAREFFMKFKKADCPYIAIENPVPLKIAELGRETQAINPYDFGHPYSKRTCLWLHNLPPLLSTCVCPKHRSFMSHADGCSKARSKTFSGIADAMAKQWSDFILHDFYQVADKKVLYCDFY